MLILHHMRGVHLDFQDLPKDFYRLKAVIPEDESSETEIAAKIISFYDWYCGPNGVNVHFDECFVHGRSLVLAYGLASHQLQ